MVCCLAAPGAPALVPVFQKGGGKQLGNGSGRTPAAACIDKRRAQQAAHGVHTGRNRRAAGNYSAGGTGMGEAAATRVHCTGCPGYRPGSHALHGCDRRLTQQAGTGALQDQGHPGSAPGRTIRLAGLCRGGLYGHAADRRSRNHQIAIERAGYKYHAGNRQSYR